MKQSEFDKLEDLNACDEATEWLTENRRKSAATLYLECERPDWMLWLFWRLNIPRATRIKLAVKIVRETPLHDGRTVFDLLTDERSRNALVVAERYADGQATGAELDDAIKAAREARYAAAAAAAAAAAGYAAAAAAAAAAYAADAADAYAAYADAAAYAYAADAAAADAAADAADAYAAYADAAAYAYAADAAAADAAAYAAYAYDADAARKNTRAKQCDIIRSIFPTWQDVLSALPAPAEVA